MPTITRRLEFDAAHRVMKHESKCRNLHGHRYAVEITVTSEDLDPLGRVIDFSVLKSRIGEWVDEKLDHGSILNRKDKDLIEFCEDNDWKVFVLWDNPTAENIASLIMEQSESLLSGTGIDVEKIRVYETPNCWADCT